MLIFDAETGPLEESVLLEMYTPLDESEIKDLVTGDFDPSTVKVGNLKDPTKIEAKITEARNAHETALANSGEIIAKAKAEHWSNYVENAALSPITGKVLVIGYHSTEKGITIVDDGQNDHGGNPEANILVAFWKKYERCRVDGRKMVGHNINGFDIPFLVRRSWMLDIPVPATVFDKGKWIDNTTLVDTMALWGCGNRENIKLDLLARAFGVGAKTEGINGGDFWKLFQGGEVERAKAIEYAANDVVITAKVAQRMGLV